MSLREKYQDILHPDHTKAHVKVPCSAAEIVRGMEPHIQPGVLLEYHAGSQMLATLENARRILPNAPAVHVNFEVRDFDVDKLRPTPGEGAPAVGTLQTKNITKVMCEVGKDKLTADTQQVFENIQPGETPNYNALRYVCAQRVMALETFQAAEARSSGAAIARANEALTAVHAPVEAENFINTLRTAYSADSYPGPHTFDPNNFDMFRMRGFTYANPLGMDVPMRAMQTTMQLLTSSMNLDSMEHIQTFFDTMAQHPELTAYDGSEQADMQLHDALREALVEFALKCPSTAMQSQVGVIADNALHAIIANAKEEASKPLAQQLNQMLQGKAVFGSLAPMSTQIATYSRFEHMVKQQLSAGDTLAGAEQHAVSRLAYEDKNRGEISDVIVPSDDTPTEQGDNLGDETVGDDAI